MGIGGFLKPFLGGFIMKKSLLLALAFAAVCGYVMAEEETTTTTPASKDETTQAAPAPVAPVTQEPATQEDELDMDAMLDETEEAK